MFGSLHHFLYNTIIHLFWRPKKVPATQKKTGCQTSFEKHSLFLTVAQVFSNFLFGLFNFWTWQPRFALVRVCSRAPVSQRHSHLNGFNFTCVQAAFSCTNSLFLLHSTNLFCKGGLRYLLSFYLRFCGYSTENWPFLWSISSNLQSS